MTTLQEIMADIHALSEDLEAYKRKYGVLSVGFCYTQPNLRTMNFPLIVDAIDSFFKEQKPNLSWLM